MTPNIVQNLQTYVNTAIENYLKDLSQSYPCKVLSYADGLVEVETLLVKGKNDVPVKIPPLQSPYFTLPIQEGDIGIALNCSYLFAPILEDLKIEANILSTQKNGLFFIPLLQKTKQNEVGDITFKTAPEFKSSMIFNDESLNIVVAENTKCTIDGSTMSFSINDKAVINLSESELALKISGNDALTIGSTISTPLGIEQTTPISISGSGGSMKDFASYIMQLLDALSSGMKGSATENSFYVTTKTTLQPKIEGLFK